MSEQPKTGREILALDQFERDIQAAKRRMMVVTDDMVDVAMPWMSHWSHMRDGDKRSALREAIKAALSAKFGERQT